MSCLYRAVIEADGTTIDDMFLPEVAAVHMLLEMDYDDFGEPALIAAPLIPQRYAPAASLLLDTSTNYRTVGRLKSGVKQAARKQPAAVSG